MLAEFELQNKCKIILSSSLVLRNGYLDMQWTATSVEERELESEAPYLDCVSVSVWAGDFKTLMGLVTRLLYSMDFQFALEEFKKVETKKA